jgi:DNA polymerase alpha subunit A
MNSPDISALEEDGSFNFHWIDYLEPDGQIYFTGKVKDTKAGAWGDDGDFYDTDIVPSLQDAYADFEFIRKELGIESWRAKFMKRKYAFGEKGVPRQVVYGFGGKVSFVLYRFEGASKYFSEPQVTLGFLALARTHFGLLVLKRKIMGSCWLKVKNPVVVDKKGVSLLQQSQSRSHDDLFRSLGANSK